MKKKLHFFNFYDKPRLKIYKKNDFFCIKKNRGDNQCKKIKKQSFSGLLSVALFFKKIKGLY